MIDKTQSLGVWFPAIKTGTGTDQFTERLVAGLNAVGIRASVTWLPHRTEYLAGAVNLPAMPEWANVVHINSWLPHRVVPKGTPTVATFHFCIHDAQAEKYVSIAQRLYHRLLIKPREQMWCTRSRLTAVSRYTAEGIRAALGCELPEIIHNWVDTRVFYPNRKSAEFGGVKLLFAGNPIRRKGSDLLAAIIDGLEKNYTLSITADEGCMPRYLRSHPRIKAIGRVNSCSEMCTVYNHHDILLFPSRVEGFSLAALEALACGIPVVASDSSSFSEVVSDGECGYLCKVNDVDDFVNKVRKLGEDPVLHKSMARKAVDRAKCFDLNSTIDRYATIYKNLLSESD